MQTKDLYALFLRHPLIDTDSRSIRPGSLFFALKGQSFNGNDYAPEALAKGAAYVITDEPTPTPPQKTVQRKSALLALQQLAAEHRKHLSAKIIGITGTNGKTTTKELIHAVLSTSYNTASTHGNLNNHIGVPLTLLSIPSETEMAVLEMGANHPGEIAALCRIADPDVALITNIGKAHLEGFTNKETIFQTKKALFDHVTKKNGTLFFPGDDPCFSAWLNYPSHIAWGKDTFHVSGTLTRTPPKIQAHIKGQSPYFKPFETEINSPLFGAYNLYNIMAAIAVGKYFHVSTKKIKQAIENYIPSNNRSQIIHTDKNTVIMDAYNANPSSMKNALDSFLMIPNTPKAVILGDMLEMGETAIQEHQTITHFLSSAAGVKKFFVGNIFSQLENEDESLFFANTDACIRYLKENLLSGYTILIKGSRGIHLETTI
ncbi:MAG: UDP-N-acetylmuramoyl-tripeptide--D-alanyl-D-alanine ligase, partial [Bacteroidales bacterium]|nr:UDP-N-acetylmuramoyl-tripeptide--D-alanyl-D-alanine ligase [Bacteroidales bacterium]